MAHTAAFLKATMLCAAFTLFSNIHIIAQNYTITTTGNAIVVTDISGNSEAIAISQNGSNLRIIITGRTYSLNGGAITQFNTTPADVAITGATTIAINAAAGNDTVNVGAFTAILPSLTIDGGTGNDQINMNGNISFALNANLNVDLQNDNGTPGVDEIYVNNGADLVLSGTGALDFKVSKTIVFGANATLRTVNGNLTLEANQTNISGVDFTGIDATAASILIESTGSGSVTLKGRGGNTSSTADNYGIWIDGSSTIRGGTSGTVTIDAWGGRSLSLGNVGILLGNNSTITSLGASISITGHGGESFLHNIGMGVAGTITAGGAGTVTIVATGGWSGDNRNNGLNIVASAFISSAGGNVSVTGNGGSYGLGTGGYNRGIYMAGGTITAGGMGTVTVIGKGGLSDGGSPYNDGIYITTATITSSGGDVYIQGEGAAEPISQGINIRTGTSISAGGTGNLNLTGVVGSDYGVYADGATIFASGTINISATSGSNAAFNLASGTIVNNGPGRNINITANSMNFGGGSINTTSTGTVNLYQNTNGNNISIGAADGVMNPLGLTDAELDMVITPTPNIALGDTNSGTFTIGAAVSRSYTTNATIYGNPITPNVAGTDIDLIGGTLTLGTGSKLNIDIDGLSVDTLYKQLKVLGQVNLNNATLTFTGSTHTPALGQSFTLVNNDGIDAVSGTFNGLTQAGVIANFLGTLHGAQISYTGGTGNDVVITIIPLQSWYLDADNDGRYVSGPVSAYVSPGAGYNLTATVSGDCDDNDNTKWQMLIAYVDADADGYTVGNQLNICSGAGVPVGYSAASSGADCNDNNPAVQLTQTWYLDADNDGNYTSIQNTCLSPGSGWTLTAGISGDCDDNNNTKWQILNGYADADADGYTVGGQTSVCSGATLPTGYVATSLGADCNDNNNAVHATQTWYLDADNDGYYISSLTSCGSPGAGYNTTATINGDCNDSDNTKWQTLSGYVDADNDGYIVGNQISVCSGATLPTGYAATSLGTDCNDNNATITTASQTWYLDADNDGHYTSSQIACSTPGSGWNQTAIVNGDCNDGDNTKWQQLIGYVDADGDGYTIGTQVSVCSGVTLPNGYALASLGTDCDDNNAIATLTQTWYLDADNDGYYISTLNSCASPGTGYNTTATTSGDCDDNDNTKWQQLIGYVDADGDGYTVGTQVNVCSGATLPNGYALASLGTDCDDNNAAATISQTWYLDADNDGYYTASQTACTSPGMGWTNAGTANGDCTDLDDTKWQELNGYVDADGDGYTVGTQVSVCTGAALPNGYAATSLGEDCNDNDATVLGAPCNPNAISEVGNEIVAVSLYPNPTENSCSIKLDLRNAGKYTLQMKNAIGQVIWTRQYTGIVGENVIELNLEGYSAGMYIASVSQNSSNLNLRIVKQ